MNYKSDRSPKKVEGAKNDVSLVYGAYVLFLVLNLFTMSENVITILPLALLPVYLLFRKSRLHVIMGIVMLLIGLSLLSLVAISSI